MKHIAVFCSAQELDEKYNEPAKELARLIAENGYHLVWGGSDKGLMKTIAAGVREGGGRLVGVSVHFLSHMIHKSADEMIIAKDLGERKATMLKRCDAVVTLVGGTGTLDEITDIMELKRHNLHDKPIVILNTDNFYEGLRIQLKKMKDDGLLSRPIDELIIFADTPQEAMDHIKTRFRDN